MPVVGDEGINVGVKEGTGDGVCVAEKLAIVDITISVGVVLCWHPAVKVARKITSRIIRYCFSSFIAQIPSFQPLDLVFCWGFGRGIM